MTPSRGDFEQDAKEALFSLLGEDFVDKHFTKEHVNIEGVVVDKITLENMKKYLDDVLTIVLMKTDKNKIDDFVNYKSKEFLRLSQNQSEQAVYEAMRGIVLHDNMSEGSSNIMEVVGHFSSSCVPFPRQLRSILWDIEIEKVEKPRRREFNQLALASFTTPCDNSLKQEVIDYHVTG